MKQSQGFHHFYFSLHSYIYLCLPTYLYYELGDNYAVERDVCDSIDIGAVVGVAKPSMSVSNILIKDCSFYIGSIQICSAQISLVQICLSKIRLRQVSYS